VSAFLRDGKWVHCRPGIRFYGVGCQIDWRSAGSQSHFSTPSGLLKASIACFQSPVKALLAAAMI